MTERQVVEMNTERDDGTSTESVTTRHTISVAGTELEYVACAQRLTISDEAFETGKFQGVKPQAEVFITSYTLAGADAADRPVVFAFNGGPGSPSVWLHFGLLGPRRIDSGDVDGPVSPPYRLLDNAETLLTEADIVFIDPMTTGYSRASLDVDPSRFHGFSGDLHLVAETIRLWTTENQRWLSPKFLAGESYGATRAAALSKYLLAECGMALNGLMLIAPALDFEPLLFVDGHDEAYLSFLPTYAATAYYHGKHQARTLDEVVTDAVDFAAGEYRLALAEGNRIPEDRRHAIAAKIADLCGLDAHYVMRSNLRIQPRRFAAELLREDALSLGLIDSRFTMHPGRLDQDQIEVDPCGKFITQAYTVAANHYLRAELGFESTLKYEIMSERVNPWSYGEFENGFVHTSENLAYTMRVNPSLKVYVANGYYDGATPFASTEFALAHLSIPEDRYADILTCYYEAGHMMYLHEAMRIAQAEHLRQFIRWVLGAERPTIEPVHAKPAVYEF